MTKGKGPDRVILLAAGGLLVLFSLWVSLVSHPVVAVETPNGEFDAFGPENFIRATGPPITEVRSFTILNPNTQYSLRIDNGGASHQFARVSSAEVWLNGARIVGPHQFNQTVSVIVQPVTLSTTNQLAIVLRSRPGSGFTLRIIGVDNEPPSITASVSPPANEAGWHSLDPTVSFECSDAISGIASCTEPVLIDTEGANQVVIGTAVDRAGNSSSISVTLNVDKTPAVLSDILPSDGELSPEPEVNLTGTVADALSGVQTVTCNTSNATVEAVINEAGDVPVFACSLPLLVGSSLIQVQATDIAGNVTTTILTIHHTPRPDIAIKSPTDLEVFVSSPVMVTGTVDDSGATVTVNDIPASVAKGQFAASVPLASGLNTITAVAQNVAGTGSDSVRAFAIIGSAPTVGIDSPSNDFVLGRQANGSLSVSVNGWIRDNRPIPVGQPEVTVRFNNTPVIATVTQGISGACLLPLRCWKYTATRLFPPPDGVLLSINVEAETGGGTASRQISGIVDFCFDCRGSSCGTSACGASLFQGCQQSRRCIINSDGCSGPFGEKMNNDPTRGRWGRTSTAFGQDEIADTPEGAFTVFGQPRPIQLPCSRHDECYLQRCPQERTRPGVVTDKKACDLRFFDEMKAVCQLAYPETICPADRIGILNCSAWRLEKSQCYAWARRYYNAVDANTQRYFLLGTYNSWPYANEGDAPRHVQCEGCPGVQ